MKKTGIMGLIRIAIKFPLFAMALVLYFIVSFCLYLLCGMSFERARPYLTRVIALTSIVGLRIIGIKVVQNFKQVDTRENFLIVSNHLSYVDVLVISSLFPSCFVTSKEMKETLFLGQICLLGGCLFVDRKKRHNIHNEVRELTNALSSGLNVAIFPEATSTDGSAVLGFKRPLFQAAIDARAKVLPMCLNYLSIDGQKVTLQNRDTMFWYGDMTFFAHAVELFAEKNMIVELTVLDPFLAEETADKTLLAEKCHQLVSSHYHNIIS